MNILKNLCIFFLLIWILNYQVCAQNAKPPYPIIFVHGWNGSETAWMHDQGNWKDFLQEEIGWNYGGIIHICLDNVPTSLNDPIEADVAYKDWTEYAQVGNGNGNADFFFVNFNIKNSGNTEIRPKVFFNWITLTTTNSNTVYFSENEEIVDQIIEGDILYASGITWSLQPVEEYMIVTGVDYPNHSADVERGKFGSEIINWAEMGGANPIKNHSNLSNQSSIIKGAKGVKIAIDRVKEETGSNKVILVAHSMGGLNCRTYISNKISGDPYIENTPYENDVAKLITISTPHLGSNSSDIDISILNQWNDLDLQSDAVRDLRSSRVDGQIPGGLPPEPDPWYGDYPDEVVFD